MMFIDTYIIHWKELKDRRKYLELQFPNAHWIDFYDRNTIDNDDIKKIYKADKNTWYDRVNGLYNNPPEYRDLRISEICNSLSHIYVFDNMIQNNIEYGLVLEDDVILTNNFFSFFDHYFSLTPSDFDLIFLGSAYSPQILDSVGCENNKSAIKVQNGVFVYEKYRNPKTRCVDAYILKKSTCEKLKNIINEISLPYDFDLAYFIKELDLKVYWWEPGLVFQGSQKGYYNSSIR